MDDVAGIWRFVRSVRVQDRRRLLFFTGAADQLEAINLQMSDSHGPRGEVVVREEGPAGELFLLLDEQTRAVAGHATPDGVTLDVQDAPTTSGRWPSSTIARAVRPL